MMQKQKRRIKYRYQMMYRTRIRRTDGIVPETMMIGHGDDEDADDEQETSQAKDGSRHSVKHSGHSISV
jgi:hypothetical protein